MTTSQSVKSVREDSQNFGTCVGFDGPSQRWLAISSACHVPHA